MYYDQLYWIPTVSEKLVIKSLNQSHGKQVLSSIVREINALEENKQNIKTNKQCTWIF